MDKLCGVIIAKNAIKYDYCVKESILSMLGVCDYVICAYVESEDNTLEILEGIDAQNFKILKLMEDDWNFYNDKHRLSYITNIAIQEADRMGFAYVLYVQADEVLHEDSYLPIRKAIEENHEGYLCNRINLWKSPNLYIDVPQERKPCSTEVIRLAKASYRAYDDAENISAQVHSLLDDVVIWHYGFVRKAEVMKDKITNMQVSVFGMGSADEKLTWSETFNPDFWFNPLTDLKPIKGEHPKVIQEWIKTRP